MNCLTCSNQTENPIRCETNNAHIFCSEKCAQHKAIEDDIQGSCPGVYWCAVCSSEYLEAAKGHHFLLQYDKSTDGFSDRCTKCYVWCYDFKSKTKTSGKFEGVSCKDLCEIMAVPDAAHKGEIG